MNEAYTSPYEQLSFFDGCTSSFEDNLINDDFREIFGGVVSRNDGYKHCVVVYETNGWELRDVDILFLDKSLNPIEDESWNEYIRPDYAALTHVEPDMLSSAAESKSSKGLLSLKPIVLPEGAEDAVKIGGDAEIDTAASPTQLRELVDEA